MFLNSRDFKKIIKFSPLVGIDLFVFSKNKKYILLEKRINKPAKNYFFNFGGRLQKNEKIKMAIKRISKREIDKSFLLKKIKFIDYNEHFYKNSFFGKSINTHYVVLIFFLNINYNALKKYENKLLSILEVSKAKTNLKVHKYVREVLIKNIKN